MRYEKYFGAGKLSQDELPIRVYYEVVGTQLPRRLFKRCWHYCMEWDGMLLVPGDLEMQACTCDIGEGDV